MRPGDHVDRYVVERPLGDGGAAEVFLVRHVVLDTRLALKVMSRQGAGTRARALREAKTQASLDHPNVVRVLDVLDVGGRCGLLMDYVRGPSLFDAMCAARFVIDEVDLIARDLLSAVATAHGAGIVHRDLKPANVLLDVTVHPPRCKVTDFGIARVLGEVGPRQTRDGSMLGTPAYMAPEQQVGSLTVDARADVFALATMLFELLTGELPFPADDLVARLRAIAAGPPPLEVGPARMRRAIRAGLAADPAARPPDAHALWSLWEDGAPRPTTWTAASINAILIAAGPASPPAQGVGLPTPGHPASRPPPAAGTPAPGVPPWPPEGPALGSGVPPSRSGVPSPNGGRPAAAPGVPPAAAGVLADGVPPAFPADPAPAVSRPASDAGRSASAPGGLPSAPGRPASALGPPANPPGPTAAAPGRAAPTLDSPLLAPVGGGPTLTWAPPRRATSPRPPTNDPAPPPAAAGHTLPRWAPPTFAAAAWIVWAAWGRPEARSTPPAEPPPSAVVASSLAPAVEPGPSLSPEATPSPPAEAAPIPRPSPARASREGADLSPPSPSAATSPSVAAPQAEPTPTPTPTPTAEPTAASTAAPTAASTSTPAPRPARPAATTPWGPLPAAPAPRPTRWRAEGARWARLMDSAGRLHPPGDLPPGTYKLQVMFEGDPQPIAAGVFEVRAKETTVIRCQEALRSCQ